MRGFFQRNGTSFGRKKQQNPFLRKVGFDCVQRRRQITISGNEHRRVIAIIHGISDDVYRDIHV